MNRAKLVNQSIALVMVTLVLAGCAAPAALEAAPCPTSAPQACPTCPPQSCPPAAVQAIPTMTSWQKNYYEEANLRITFDPGKKCSMDILTPVTDSTLFYEVVVNDQTFQNYIVVALTLEEGKTLKDIETYDKTAIGVVPPPPGSQIRLLEIVPPMSRTLHSMPMPYNPIYLVCLIEGPDQQQPIEQFGPVEVGQ